MEAKNAGMLMAIFEEELILLRSTREAVEFAGLSRWLEGVLLRAFG